MPKVEYVYINHLVLLSRLSPPLALSHCYLSTLTNSYINISKYYYIALIRSYSLPIIDLTISNKLIAFILAAAFAS